MNFSHIQIHGHRGCRGLYPENTLPAFEYALESGVDAIELDVVITGDNKVLVSHEPWFSHEYCIDPFGMEITEDNEKSFNIYKMTYDQIKQFDCGSRRHSRFPHQKNLRLSKPLLVDVIKVFQKREFPAFYNIEIKSEPEHYNLYQPQPVIIVAEVVKVLKQFSIENKFLLQSFDPNILIEIQKNYPEMKCALLIEEKTNIKEDLNNLQFLPFGYNLYYKLITREIIEFCKSKNIQVLAWTVNELADMKEIAELGVDGIITDYPDRAISLFR